MRTISTFVLFASLLLVLFVAGCSDDDSPTGTSASSPSIMVFSAIYLEAGRLVGYMESWDVTSSGKHIDSIHIGPDLKIDDLESWYWAGDDQYWSANLWNYFDSGYTSGDTVTVRLFDAGNMAEVNIKILDRQYDSVVMITVPSGPIALNSTPQFVWRSFDDADFYTVSADHYYEDSSGHSMSVRKSWATTDTTITLPSTLTAHDGDLNFNVMPYRGPRPTGEGVVPANVSTATMRGQIWTYGRGQYRNFSVGAGFSLVNEVGSTLQMQPEDILRDLTNIR
ncbi:MAG: hypothetical protein KKA42_00040 [candidate division Zixibacteria bacterium]|nr:hypothetical protein [candidate division Zixibacteria bacterium]